LVPVVFRDLDKPLAQVRTEIVPLEHCLGDSPPAIELPDIPRSLAGPVEPAGNLPGSEILAAEQNHRGNGRIGDASHLDDVGTGLDQAQSWPEIFGLEDSGRLGGQSGPLTISPEKDGAFRSQFVTEPVDGRFEVLRVGRRFSLGRKGLASKIRAESTLPMPAQIDDESGDSPISHLLRQNGKHLLGASLSMNEERSFSSRCVRPIEMSREANAILRRDDDLFDIRIRSIETAKAECDQQSDKYSRGGRGRVDCFSYALILFDQPTNSLFAFRAWNCPMDSEETRHQELLGYDEQSETWYVQTRESGRLILSRQSLARLVQLYNEIHKGSPFVLLEQRELRRMEETRQRQSEILRDLYLFLDRKERRRPVSIVRRFLRRVFQRS